MPIDILEELRRRHVGAPEPDAPVYITDSLAKRSIGAGGSFTDPVEEFLGPESRAFGALEASAALTSGMAVMTAGGLRGIGAALMGKPLEEVLEEVERPEVFGIPAYEPRSKRGIAYAEKIMWPLEKVHESAKWWGDQVFSATGNPDLAATVSTVVESAALFAGPSLLKRLPGISKSSVLKLRRKLGKAKRTRDFTDPELKVAIEDVLAEAKKDPAMMADVQRALDTTFVEAAREPTMEALEKIRAERKAEVSGRVTELERLGKRTAAETEALIEEVRGPVPRIMPEEPKVAAPRVEPEVKPVEPVREYRGEKAPEEARAFKLADELGLDFEAYAKPEPGIVGAGYLFSATERAHPTFKGAETSFSVEKLSDLPAAVEAKTKWWKERLAAREAELAVPEVVPEVPKPRKAPPKPTPESQATKFELEYKGPRDEPTGIVHEYFDPQTGEHFVADSAATVGRELETHRRLVNERSVKYSTLTVDDFAKLARDWWEGKGEVDVKVLKEQLQDFLAKKPRGDFETTADFVEFIDRGEELLGIINKGMREKGLIVEPIEDIIAERPEAIGVRRVLEDGDVSEPKTLSGADRINYIKESAKKRSRLDRRQIEALIEEGVDISDKLPPEAQTAYTVYKDMQEMGTVNSEPRGVADIYRDLTEIFDERGSLSYEHLTHEQKMALQRLVGDAKKMVGDFTEYLKSLGLTRSQILMVRRHIDEIRKVEPETFGEPRSTWIDAKAIARGDKIVKQRKTGRGKQAIPLYKSEVGAVQSAIELKTKRFAGFENPIRTFEESGLKDLVYYDYRAAEQMFRREWSDVKADVKGLKKGVGWKSRKRIGAYAIAQQERGLNILKRMKIEVPTLTDAEMGTYNALRGRYENLFERIQVMREMLGKEPLEKVDNYFTFFRAFGILEKAGIKTNPLLDKPGVISKRYASYGSTPFRFGIERLERGAMPVELDPFKVYEGYTEVALRHLHLSPLVAKVHELLLKLPDPNTGKLTWQLKDYKPNLAKFLEDWKNHIAGYPNAWKLPRTYEKPLSLLSQNLAYSVLGANIRSSLIQVSALRNTCAEVGLKYTLDGILSTIKDVGGVSKNRKFALKHSKILDGRAYDIAIEDAMRIIRGGRVGDAFRTLGRASLKPLQWLDLETAIVTWNGAFKLAESRGYGRKRAVNFADDVVTRTQASALPGDLAPIQRSVLGKAFTLFQTFVINDWGFLTRDVLGINNAKIGNDVVLRKAMRYVIATTLFNVLMEDVIGVQSPFPTPVKDLMRSLKEEDTPDVTLRKVAFGLIDPIPIIGSARYGRGPGGPILETATELVKSLQEAPMAKPLPEVVGRVSGIPGVAQVSKMRRARKRGETPWGQVVGTYTPRREGRESGLKGLGGLGGL